MSDSHQSSDSELVAVPATPAAAGQAVADPDAPAIDGVAFLNGLRPKSAFWHARKLELQLQAFSAAKLEQIKGGIDGVGDKVSAIQFPAAVDVTTKLGTDDHALFATSAQALHDISQVALATEGNECGRLQSVSDLAFVLIARLTTLTAYLMDMEKVTADSVLDQIRTRHAMIEELAGRLKPVPRAAEILLAAVDPAAFETIAQQGPPEAVFPELNKRAALLLALKCLVATSVRDEDAPGEWPPADDGEVIGKAPRGAARKKAGR